MKKGIKAIIFDVGGVLALDKKSFLGVHGGMPKKLGISIDQYFDSVHVPFADSEEGKISSNKAFEIASGNLNISKNHLRKIYYDVYKKNFIQNKSLLRRVFELKSKGYLIAILSDQVPFSKEAMMPKETYKNFDVVVVSCDEKVRKPSPESYKLVLKKLKLEPKETLFIDNREWNTGPAKKLGMKTILFKNNKQLFKDKQWKGLFE